LGGIYVRFPGRIKPHPGWFSAQTGIGRKKAHKSQRGKRKKEDPWFSGCSSSISRLLRLFVAHKKQRTFPFGYYPDSGIDDTLGGPFAR